LHHHYFARFKYQRTNRPQYVSIRCFCIYMWWYVISWTEIR